MTADLATLLGVNLAVLLAVVAVGFAAARRAGRSPEEFLLAGRSVRTLVLFFSLFGTNVTAFVLVGIPGESYHRGIGVFGQNAAIVALGIPLTFYLIGYPAWRAAKRLRALTPAELYAERFGSPAVGYVLFAAFVPYTLLYMVIVVQGCGITLEGLTDGKVPYEVALVLVLGIALAYTAVGGMRATAWTNVLQGALFLAFTLVAFATVSGNLGGLERAFERLRAERPALLVKGDHEPFAFRPWFSWGVVISFTVIAFPHILVRMLAAKDVTALKNVCRLYPIALVGLWLPCVLFGVFGALEFPDLVGRDSDLVYPLMIGRHLSSSLAGLGLASVLAAAMSTLDAQILTLSSMLTRDVLLRRRPGLSDRAQVRATRLFSVAAALAVFVAALPRETSIFGLATFAFSGYVMLVPTLFLSLRWRRFTAAGAIASVLAGNAAFLAAHFGLLPTVGFLPVVPGLLAALAAGVGVSLASAPCAASLTDRALGARSMGAALLALFLCAVPASAQDGVRFEMENGLRVRLHEMKGVPDVALVVLYDFGGDHDPPGRSGLAHAIEHLYVTAAAGKAPARTVQEYAAAYPKGANAQTGARYTVVSAVFPGSDLEREIEDAAARMGDLRIEPADLDREKPRLHEELENMFVRSPTLAASNRASERVRPTPSGGRKGGLPAQVAILELPEIRERWSRLYKPANAILVIAGGFEIEKGAAAVRRHFGGIPAGERVGPAPPAGEPRPGGIEILEPDSTWPGVPSNACIAWATPDPTGADYAPFLVLAARLVERTWRNRDPAEPTAGFQPIDLPETFRLSANLRAGESAAEAVARLESLAREVLAAPFESPERGKALLYFGNILGVPPFPGMRVFDPYLPAFSRGRAEQLGIEASALKSALEGVTMEDVRRVADSVLGLDRRAAAVVTAAGTRTEPEAPERMPTVSAPRLYRVILPVSDVGKAAAFYEKVLGIEGKRVSPGRHYFDCGGTILACFDPRADGDTFDARPNPDHVYLAVADLEATFSRARTAGCSWIEEKIETRPWGERSFYAKDPFGNPICFVDEKTIFTGR